MSKHSSLIAATMIFLVLVAGCGTSEPPAAASATSAAPAKATAPSTEAAAQTAAAPDDTVTPQPSPTATLGLSPLDGTGKVERTALTYGDLMEGFDTASPVDDSALALPEDAAHPDHVFEGRLELIGEATHGGYETVKGTSDLDPRAQHIAEFDYEFVQSGSHLIPTQRGLVIADHPNWNYILGPGRVWQEKGDQGYSRASFPFAMV